MKILKGVIAASTYADYGTPLADANLFIEPWYFTLTSKPYLIEEIESLDSTANASLGLMWVPPLEALNSSADAVSINNVTILVRFTQGGKIDAVDSQADAVSANLVYIPPNPPIKFTADTESVDSQADAVAASLEVVLIRYSVEPESINSTADAVSGSLT